MNASAKIPPKTNQVRRESPGTGGVEVGLIVLAEGGGEAPREGGESKGVGVPPHNLRIARMADQVGHSRGQVGDVPVFDQLAGGLGNNLGGAAGARAETGLAVGHGLEEDQTEA